jgi:hypothetical protein
VEEDIVKPKRIGGIEDKESKRDKEERRGGK